MSDVIAKFTSLPSYGISALVVLLLYAIQSEIRFGKSARTMRTGAADRKSTLVVSISTAIPILGFALAMKSTASWLPEWFRTAVLPGLPAIAWCGVGFGLFGVAIRLWAVLTLRHRYTRTLLIQDTHAFERGGPYRWVRHPGYLGSLLVLNGIALASGNWFVLPLSLVATVAAYSYRMHVEDEMLVTAFGQAYADYRRQVGAILPIPHRDRGPDA
jgi:protein-S-isoprenylcysteine O-methyltransferase